MLSKHLLSCLACAAALGGCASTPPAATAPVTLAGMMNEAEAALNLGKTELGVTMFKSAAAAFPKEKAPRLRAAQVQFDCHNYGEAIMHAKEVLDRDANDLVANSIIAASGLRVSSKALTELAERNNLTGSVRAEAQDLVKMLRENIKGPIIAVGPKPGPKPGMQRVSPQANPSVEEVMGGSALVKTPEKR
jgi:hypothetical protein